jgi:ABC-type polysaccharide/polyol phosphate transport system ATPase subunit
MRPENIIEVQRVSLCYRAYRSRRRSLREALFRFLLRRDELVRTWALRDVSFSVRRGDSLGVIGANGSGKSTLCLILAQILRPTSGRVEVAGRVSALLTLGAGFQGELTGGDNIFINGVFLGLRLEEVKVRYQEIVDFSGLQEVIDMPLRTYSSGMRARLAFSIAAAVEPEILIVDELMGVGDRRFREKSTERMKEMVARSRALIVVSHSMDTIRSLCSHVILLSHGRLTAQGPAEEVIREYEAG